MGWQPSQGQGQRPGPAGRKQEMHVEQFEQTGCTHSRQSHKTARLVPALDTELRARERFNAPENKTAETIGKRKWARKEGEGKRTDLARNWKSQHQEAHRNHRRRQEAKPEDWEGETHPAHLRGREERKDERDRSAYIHTLPQHTTTRKNHNRNSAPAWEKAVPKPGATEGGEADRQTKTRRRGRVMSEENSEGHKTPRCTR